MSCRIRFGPSRRFYSVTWLFLLLALVLAAPAGAQKAAKANGPKYDLQTEAKLKGTIDEIKLPPKGSEKEIVHLTLKSGADTLDVYLCPKSFMNDMGMDFGKGDDISLTGSKVKVADADVVLAREVAKGNNSFIMRDAKGAPVW
jgi:hypothetical protein